MDRKVCVCIYIYICIYRPTDRYTFSSCMLKIMYIVALYPPFTPITSIAKLHIGLGSNRRAHHGNSPPGLQKLVPR